MSTGTALTQITEPAHKNVATLGTGAVTAIVPQTFDEVFRFSQVLARSGLCPYGMDTPEKVSVAILTGLEIGVKPMQAVQGIAVIGGRPCIWGDLSLGIVRSSGLLESFTETFEGEPPEDWTAAKQTGKALQFKAVCRVKRQGQPEAVGEFSIEDATIAKLWGKKGHNGKDTPWITNPKRMLKMRARAFALRDTFADVLKGMHLAEEMIGSEDDGLPARIAGPTPPPPAPEDTAPKQIAQPAAPPPEARAAESVSPVPAAPPVEDAEIVETPSPEEGGGNDAAAQDDADKGEPFDGAAWLEETAEVFATCKTEQDVDEAHEMFEGTVQHELNKDQRYQYEKLHTDAMMRTKGPSIDQTTPAAPPADDEDDSFPGDDAIKATEKPKEPSPGAAYMDRIRQAIADPVRTAASLTGLWNATGDERKALERDGHLAKEDRMALRGEIAARISAAATADGPSAPPAGPSAPPSDEDPAATFDRDFRAKVADCGTVEDLNSLSTNTLKQRNAFGSMHPLYDGWREAVSHRRKQLSGVA